MAKASLYKCEVEVTYLVPLEIEADDINDAVERARSLATGEGSGAVIISNFVTKCELL